MTSIQIDIKDGLSSSVAIKGPCRVATTANITLVGEQTIDGVAVVTDDRVLVKDQTTASENGIYIADTGNWRRSKDFNKTKDVKTGTMVNVTAGTVGSGQWQVSTTGDITIGTTNLAFNQVVQPYDADLASWAAITRAAGFDTFVATPSSANLRTLLTDETGSGAAVFANTPTLVTPNVGAATGLSLNVQTTGTGATALARYQHNSMVISADDIDAGLDGGKIDGLTVNHLFGGAAARGGRHALETFCVLTAATASDNPDRHYCGAAFTGWAIASDGGGVGTEKGGIFGINSQGVLANGATNFSNVTGGEINVAINTGASSKYKSGLSICNRSDDAVKGSQYDALLALSNQTATVRFDYGILIGPMNGAHPVDTTGTIIGTSGAATVTNGIDFSSYTISGSFLKGPGGFSVSGSGNLGMAGANASIELGTVGSVNTPFIDFHSSANVNDYDVRLIASGGAAGDGLGLLSLTGGFAVSGFTTAAFFQPTGATVPANGFYLPAANTIGWAVNTTAKMRLAGSALTPAVDDGTALGTTALEWSDLFLASGGVINWANGDATLTHGTGKRVSLAGNFGRGAPVIKSADFTVADTENWLVNNKAAATCTVTLPAAASYTGREITINNYQAFTVVSASSNVVPLVGGAAGTAILAATAGKWITLVSDGANWRAMMGN